MATIAQALANRVNSAFSTGPRTPEGKAASSRNATTHGFSAADPVLAHEDRTQYRALLERYLSEFAPATAHEEFLVSQMAAARWKLNRLERIELAMFAALETPGGSATSEAVIARSFIEKDTGSGFARLERYRAGLERTYYRCVRELRVVRKEQNEADSRQMAERKSETLPEKQAAAPPPPTGPQPPLMSANPEQTNDGPRSRPLDSARIVSPAGIICMR